MSKKVVLLGDLGSDHHGFESRMGDEEEPLPRSLKLWVIVPCTA